MGYYGNVDPVVESLFLGTGGTHLGAHHPPQPPKIIYSISCYARSTLKLLIIHLTCSRREWHDFGTDDHDISIDCLLAWLGTRWVYFQTSVFQRLENPIGKFFFFGTNFSVISKPSQKKKSSMASKSPICFDYIYSLLNSKIFFLPRQLENIIFIVMVGPNGDLGSFCFFRNKRGLFSKIFP